MNSSMARVRRTTGVVLLVLLVIFVLGFLFLTPVSPLLGDIRAGVSETPLPAAGFWGSIGFYERTADNSFTYMLMLTFCALAVGKIVHSCFLPGRARRLRGGRTAQRSLF